MVSTGLRGLLATSSIIAAGRKEAQMKRNFLNRLLAGCSVAAGAIMFAAMGVTPAYAVHNDGYFQLDGDAKAATCGTAFGGFGCTGDDWDSLYTCLTPPATLGCTKKVPGIGNGATAISDLIVDPAPASIFRGGGSKDEKDISQWQWTDGSVPDKDDLIEAFAALYQPTGGPRPGHKLLYFGANRLAVNGDAQIGFWFLQKSVSLKADGTFQDSLGNPASHQLGDVLILSNFVQGGGSSNIQVYKVVKVTPGNCPAGSVETKSGAGDICVEQIVNGTAGANGVCNTAGTFPADSGCAATNGEVVDALDPDFTAKSGANAGQYPVVGFFEGGLDLTAVGLGGECFPTFVVETRSSQSITAVLKDFTIGKFENCVAEIRTEIHSAADNSDPDLQGTSVLSGAVVHDLAIVTGTIGAPVPTGNVTFKLFGSSDCTGAFTPQTVSLAVGATDARANSTPVTATRPPGVLSYNATYNGDTNYPAGAGPSTCEPLTVNKFDSSTATHIFTVDAQGNLLVDKTDNFIDLAGADTQPVRDQAVVTRDPVAAGSPTPTGTVTFTRFQFSNCTGTQTTEAVNLGTCPGAAPPSGTATACSSVFSLGPNTLGYKAIYSGDGNYNASSLSRCEPVCAIDTLK